MAYSNDKAARRTRTMRANTLTCLLLGLACSSAFGQDSQPPASAPANQTVEQLAASLSGEYVTQQMQRLDALGDRDSLIAAVLIGLPNENRSAAAEGHADVLKHLLRDFPADPLALYVAALICQAQTEPCVKSRYQANLVHVAPDNVINYLVLANGRKPSPAQLKIAAAAGPANTQFTTLLRIVRTALADQPAPEQSAKVRRQNELALILRQRAVASVPWPQLAPTTAVCNVNLAKHPEQNPDLHAACLTIGLALFFDQGQSMVARSFGGSLIRRFAPGTQSATDAIAFRRQYVWLSEVPSASTTAAKEQMDEDAVRYGEWEAFQRHADRAGVSREPPADWVPKHPEYLLLPEERGSKP